MWAVGYQNNDIVKLLLKEKPNLDIVSNYDTTVFDFTKDETVLNLLRETNKHTVKHRQYCTEIGRFDLTFYNNEVTGSYVLLPKKSTGAIWGTIDNRAFTGRWIDGDGQGDIKITFSDTFSSFSTSYRGDKDPETWYTDQWHGHLRPNTEASFEKDGKKYTCE